MEYSELVRIIETLSKGKFYFVIKSLVVVGTFC